MTRLFSAKAQLFRKYWGPLGARFGLFTLDLWVLVRRFGFGLAGLVGKGSPASRQTWKEIWQSRGTWHAAFRQTQPYSAEALRTQAADTKSASVGEGTL